MPFLAWHGLISLYYSRRVILVLPPQAVKTTESQMEHLSGVSDTLVFNMATLYELESSKAAIKKRVRARGWSALGSPAHAAQPRHPDPCPRRKSPW